MRLGNALHNLGTRRVVEQGAATAIELDIDEAPRQQVIADVDALDPWLQLIHRNHTTDQRTIDHQRQAIFLVIVKRLAVEQARTTKSQYSHSASITFCHS